MMRRLQHAAVLIVLLAMPLAGARQPDGSLGLIRHPHNARPALTRAGETFEVVLREHAPLSLINAAGNAAPLQVEWTDTPAGATGRCTVPADAKPGSYSLQAGDGDAKDVNTRAVFVVDAFPEFYFLAQVSDTHIGMEGKSPSASEGLKNIFKAVNKASASLVLITGDLTHNGAPAEFKEFLDILDTCQAPTFTTAGNHDRANYDKFMGQCTYMFSYGLDGYLSFDTKDARVADDLGPQDGLLEVYARALKTSRWSVAFTHRYERDMGMRAQLVLFVDNPVDLLVFGHYHKQIEGVTAVPWGTTPISMAPAAVDGFFVLYDVTPKGIRPHEPERAAAE